jgi:hypothetical protein
MSDGKKPELALEQRVNKLTADLAGALKQIEWMRTRGGFTDAKTHSMRATRIEERIEQVELKAEALLDVAAFSTTLMEDHLRDRHDCDVDRDSAIDATHWRKTRRRLRDLAEKLGLMNKRRDITQTRQSESRLRPQQVMA